MSMNKQPHPNAAQTRLPPHPLSVDTVLAARTSVPVLVSGDQETALRVALDIASRSGGGDAGNVMIVDAAEATGPGSFMHNAPESGGPLTTVILREIQSFTAAQQAALVELIAESRRLNFSSAWRVIATTSVPLFDRVVEGSFNARLFYFLNSIHIVMALRAESLDARPEN
jgi:transcriptional regulator of acetoin/glycerol metabolism